MAMPTIPTAVPNNPATHGKEGVIGIKIGAAATFEVIGLIQEYTLDMATDKVETTALGDGNKTYVQGLKDLKGTFTAFWDKVSDALFEAAESADGCELAIWPSRSSVVCWSGPAWLDASIKGGVTSAVSIDASFSANGAWSRTPLALTMGAGGAGQHGQPGVTPPSARPVPVWNGSTWVLPAAA
jgi:hypothetical protein